MPPSVPLSSSCENIGNMLRIYLLLLCAAPLLPGAAAPAASRVEHGSLVFDNIPEPGAGLGEKLDAYLSARQATPLGFSPKGQLLIATRFGDVDQLHLVEHAGGERRQLTFFNEPITQAAFSPDPLRSAYVYLKDAGGNENAQLYYQRLGEPNQKLLTDGKSVNGAPVWSNAGREVAFFSTARDVDVMTHAVASGAEKRDCAPVWSNAGREVAFFSTARDGVSHDIDIVDPDMGSLPRLAV